MRAANSFILKSKNVSSLIWNCKIEAKCIPNISRATKKSLALPEFPAHTALSIFTNHIFAPFLRCCRAARSCQRRTVNGRRTAHTCLLIANVKQFMWVYSPHTGNTYSRCRRLQEKRMRKIVTAYHIFRHSSSSVSQNWTVFSSHQSISKLLLSEKMCIELFN